MTNDKIVARIITLMMQYRPSEEQLAAYFEERENALKEGGTVMTHSQLQEGLHVICVAVSRLDQ